MNFDTFKMTASLLTVLFLATATEAADRISKEQPADTIAVIANVAMAGKTIDAIYITAQSRHNYIYLKDSSGATLTVLDVADAKHPSVTKTVALPQLSANDTMGAVAGNAALMIGEGTETAPRSPRTISIVDLSKTGVAKVVRKFSGVTAMRTDDERGLIYLVDDGGLQILRKNAAPDLELEAEYAKQVLYNR
jgi:hypothetical protein